jgi:signal transduction histidine kinase/ligand-binding sensor domain-containing protein
MTSGYRTFVSLIAFLLLGSIPGVSALELSDLRRDYVVDHWDTENGLPQNSVTSIAQTKDGYLWLSTFDGLARFDGVSFKVFHPTVSGQPIDSISMLSVDLHGRLWIGGVNERLLCLTPSGFVDPATWGAPSGSLEFVGESPDGNVLILGKRNGTLYSLIVDRFVKVPPASPPTKEGFATLHGDQRWGGWERRGTNWCPLNSVSNLTSFAEWPASLGKTFGWMAAGEGESILFVSPRSVQELHRGKWGFGFALPESMTELTGMVQDSRGDFWMSTWRAGLFRVSTNGASEKFTLQGGAAPEELRVIFKDREGTLWVGTDGSGLFRIKPRVFQTIGPENGLSGGVIRTVSASPDGKVWILSHGGGLDRLGGVHSKPEKPLGLHLDLPWSGLADTTGTFWIGYFGGSIRAYESWGERNVEHLEGDQRGAVRCLFEGDHRTIWVGNEKGLRAVENRRVAVVTNLPPLPHADVRSIAEDAAGKLYVALADDGLLQLDQGLWKHFTTTNGLPSNHVHAVCADQQNVVWIGYEKEGLACFKEGRFFPVPTQAGALPDSITAIFDDGARHLWLLSAKGIYRINRDAALEAATKNSAAVRVDHFGRADGLTTSECSASQPAICRTPDGLLWIATYKGVVVVDPAKVPFNALQPAVVIEQLEHDGHVIGLTAADRQSIPGTSAFSQKIEPVEMSVPAGVNRLEIQFTALSFISPQNVRFRYKLDGLDDHWLDGGTHRSASFTKLGPGPYRFRVTACNNDGVWNETGATFAFRVLPFYWQTAWFRGLIFTSVLALAFLVYHRRISELHRRQALQHQFSRSLIKSQEDERKRIAGELHDGLGHDLLVIKNRLQMGLLQEAISSVTRTELQEISGIASHAISGVRELARNLRPHLLDELGLSRAIQDTIRKVGASSSIQFDQQIENVDDCLPPEFEINFYRIVQETLNNVVKHSNASRAHLSVTRQNSTVRLMVEDNGTGFDPRDSVKAGGFGLSGLSERVRIMGGNCEIVSKPGSGTVVRIEIPSTSQPPSEKKEEP